MIKKKFNRVQSDKGKEQFFLLILENPKMKIYFKGTVAYDFCTF